MNNFGTGKMRNLPTYSEIKSHTGRETVAVILGVANFHGVAIIRALGGAGIPIYAIGTPSSLGFYSRYTSAKWEFPALHDDHENLLKLLLDIGAKLKRENKAAVLFPTTDTHTRFLAKNQESLREYFFTHFPNYEVIDRCSDKQVQYEIAKNFGVPCPASYNENEIAKLRADLGQKKISFPILFKSRQELPSHLRKQFRLIFIESQEQLENVLKQVAEEKITFLIQEIIPGEDDALYTLGSCMNRKGEFTAVFTGRKLRQRPPKFGECRVGESKLVPEIICDGEKLLRGLGFFGISQVEFKFDGRDGKYKLMEVNPRAWSWIGLPIAMKVNIPLAYFCDAIGLDIPKMTMEGKRVCWISLYFDLYWSLRARDAKPWTHCFAGYDKIVESYISMDDIKPTLLHIQRAGWDFVKMFFRQVAQKLAGKSRSE